MGHNKFLSILLLKGARIPTFRIFGRHIEFSFYIQFWWVFFLWTYWTKSFWYYNDGFPQSLTVSGGKFELFHPILMHFFWQNDHLYGLLMDHKKFCYFILKKFLKGAQFLKFGIFGRHIYHLK